MLKEDLRKQLSFVTNDYLEKLIDFYRLVDETQRIKENEIKNLRDEQNTVKENDKERERLLRIKLKKFDDQINLTNKRQKELEEEVNKQKQLNRELSVNLTKAKENTRTTQTEKEMASEELKKQVRKTETYDKKIQSLHGDDEALKKRSTRLDEREEKIIILEKKQHREKLQIIEDQQKLAEREIDVRTSEKRIKVELNKIKLNA